MNRIKKHKLVADVENEGWGGEKKYFVHLVDGYWFASHETGSKSFNSYAEFKAELIEKRPEYALNW